MYKLSDRKDVHKMAKVGILGFAHGHIFAYGGVWKEKPELGVTIVKGYDHDMTRGKESCEKLGCVFTGDISGILNDSDIDSVVISSETYYHAEYTEAAAKAGKTIICYKPMALNMEEANRIVSAVGKYRVRFSLGWQMRTDPHNIEVRQLLESGDFGRIFSLRRRHGLPTQKFANFDETWHVDPKMNRDIFADDAAHPADFVYWLMGMPDSVSATLTTMLNPKVVNDNGIAIYKYADGSLAEISCNFVSLAAENTLDIQCEKGTILLDYGDVPSTMVPHGTKGLKWIKDGDADWTYSETPSPVSHGERIAWQAGPLADFLNGKRGAIATAQEGRDVLRMILACYISDEYGQRVDMGDVRINGVV